MRIVVWLIRALLFFTLFAFALNNQHPVTVHWFFGLEWESPLIVVVLAVFAVGALLGVFAMVPNWWRARQSPAEPPAAPDSQVSAPASLPPSLTGNVEHPPRVGI